MRIGFVMAVTSILVLPSACMPVGPGEACNGTQQCVDGFHCAAVGVCTRACDTDQDCGVACQDDHDCPGFGQCVEGACASEDVECRAGYCDKKCPSGDCDHDPYAPLD